MALRGIRGAITVEVDEPEAILAATRELLRAILDENEITDFDDIISVIFTTTPDLVSTFPAEAARALGMQHVPLLCAAEIAVPRAMPRCVRVLLHVESRQNPREIKHVYLREAKRLRPDMHSPQ